VIPTHPLHTTLASHSLVRSLAHSLLSSWSTVTYLRRELETSDGWVVHGESHGIRTLSRRSSDDPHIMIRVEGMVDAKLLHIMAVFYEVCSSKTRI
jgi:hypothetical protein